MKLFPPKRKLVPFNHDGPHEFRMKLKTSRETRRATLLHAQHKCCWLWLLQYRRNHLLSPLLLAVRCCHPCTRRLAYYLPWHDTKKHQCIQSEYEESRPAQRTSRERCSLSEKYWCARGSLFFFATQVRALMECMTQRHAHSHSLSHSLGLSLSPPMCSLYRQGNFFCDRRSSSLWCTETMYIHHHILELRTHTGCSFVLLRSSLSHECPTPVPHTHIYISSCILLCAIAPPSHTSYPVCRRRRFVSHSSALGEGE